MQKNIFYLMHIVDKMSTITKSKKKQKWINALDLIK